MAKHGPKLKPEQHRRLVKEYNIHFEGPIPPSSWPRKYAEIFQNIRDIKRLRYEEYKPNERRRIHAVAEMKDRVVKLNRIAHSCRKQRENEATWRGLTEPEVVSRFAAEVVCRICCKRLWDSEFKASPDDPIAARNLRERRAIRTLCCCSLEDRALEDTSDASGGAQLFLSRFQTRFVYDPADGLKAKGLRSQEPDRVFGLRDTTAFNDHTNTRDGLRQSPFGDGRVLFPFLIVEAKSEKGSRGFESIENQTAFPIRSLLKLQQDLSAASETDMKPLVWFLTNQGEEWRVYGCIVDDSKWRIIDLWHGSLLSRDETLQLLLIVDYICDWARDIYRPNILGCLATGDVEMRDTTPAYTIISSQRDELRSLPHSPYLSTPRAMSPEESFLIDPTQYAEGDNTNMGDPFPIEEDSASVSSDDPDEEDDNLTSIETSDQNQLLRFSGSHTDPRPWSRYAAIRHSNMVLFSFHRFAVPEEGEALKAWLDSFKVPEGSTQFSQTLLRLIERSNPLTITMNGILQLENLWTRTNHQPSSENDNPLLAWIWFRSYIRPRDWQVVRELRCFTISQPTIMNLAKIAGVIRCLSPPDWDAHRCHCLTTDAQSLRSFYGRDSMIGAATTLSLRLESFVHFSGDVHFRWVKRSDDEANAATVAEICFSRSADPEAAVLTSEFTPRSSDLLEELLPGTLLPPFLVPHLRVRANFGVCGAVLVKKPFSRSESYPTYCLTVFDEMDFGDERRLGDTIIQVASSGDIYEGGFSGDLERIASPSESDMSAFRLWANILRDEAPADANWPS